MLTAQRKALLLDRLRRSGQLVAKDISQEFGLSEDTIRRDLRELAQEGLVQRVHGGALPASPAAGDFVQRTTLANAEKVAIGATAATLIRPGQIVFVDGGTTALELARRLPHGLRATIATHSPTIACALAAHPLVEVLLFGGRLFKHSVVAVGAAAVEAIGRVRADVYFMGVTGVHLEAGLSTGDHEEALIKRALSAHAAETIVLASSEKLGVASAYVVGSLAEVDALVIDGSLPAAVIAEYERLGVALIRAPAPGR